MNIIKSEIDHIKERTNVLLKKQNYLIEDLEKIKLQTEKHVNDMNLAELYEIIRETRFFNKNLKLKFEEAEEIPNHYYALPIDLDKDSINFDEDSIVKKITGKELVKKEIYTTLIANNEIRLFNSGIPGIVWIDVRFYCPVKTTIYCDKNFDDLKKYSIEEIKNLFLEKKIILLKPLNIDKKNKVLVKRLENNKSFKLENKKSFKIGKIKYENEKVKVKYMETNNLAALDYIDNLTTLLHPIDTEDYHMCNLSRLKPYMSNFNKLYKNFNSVVANEILKQVDLLLAKEKAKKQNMIASAKQRIKEIILSVKKELNKIEKDDDIFEL